MTTTSNKKRKEKKKYQFINVSDNTEALGTSLK